MGRIRMPTESCDSIAGPSNPPAPSRTSKRLAAMHQPAKRLRDPQRKKTEHKVATAAKKREKKRTPPLTAVYIGNLTSQVTVEMLKAHFASCGHVGETTIRVSRGTAVAVASHSTMRDRKYATMLFRTEREVLRAIKLQGSILGGERLVVSVAPGDLPEVLDIARPHLQNIHQRTKTPPNAALPGSNKRAKPLERKDTERDFSDPVNNRNRINIWGYSFTTTVC